MNVEGIVAAATGTGALGVAARLFRGQQARRHESILRDLALYKELPEESTVRGRLLETIDSEVDALIEERSVVMRHWPGVAAGIIILSIAFVVGRPIFTTDGPWRWFLLPAALLFGYVGLWSLWRDIPERKRDERGRPVN